MTPFGEHMRFLRSKYNKSLQQQADRLSVSVSYLSALELGKKGRPSPALIDQICVWLGLIWDEAEQIKRLALISHPRPVTDASQLGPKAIALANILANNIDRLSESECGELRFQLDEMLSSSSNGYD